MKNKLEIVYLPPEQLKPYEKNTRKHSPTDIEQIKASIEADGFNDPIGIWSDDNIIIEGHGRQIAALEMGLKSVPCIRLDHLTDTQRRDYAIRHNRTAELSEWDFSTLEEEIARLQIEGVDLSGLGFDLPEADEDSEQEQEEDETPEVPEQPKSTTGAVYQLGEHRLMCGDSTNREHVETLLNGEKAELLLTDPPYGINVVEGKAGERHKLGGDKPLTMKGVVHRNGRNRIIQEAKEYYPVIGDNTTETARKNYEIAKDYSKNQIIFGGNYFTDFLNPSRCWVVWDKQNTGSFADVELAWTSYNKGAKIYHFMWNGICRQGDRNVEGKTRVHPTQKPVGMLQQILEDFSSEGDLILDCFGGSGSTLIACEQTRRKCYMMELDPRYVDIIIERWENLTGEKAVLLDGDAE